MKLSLRGYVWIGCVLFCASVWALIAWKVIL